ncbi:MAG: methylmalonyl Co-A mutase-associated GTPase MeaB [Alphaproteobacteria bacterium]|nr:methylmalonyl Co-A mutase-associated GTPase MeaB [Alphaproteobacteria bacterium]
MTASVRRPAVSKSADRAPALADRVLGGDRRALAQAITLVESTRPDHRRAADALLEAVMPHTGAAIRLGVSGAPGVGKSTFIECFGNSIVTRGRRLAVLAVDPSSRRSGGSILGDKTRMETLARNPNAFIRPSPAGATLGGVARRTREAGLLCEAAGFDVILVETVGVGQSETAVAEMTDMFLLLLAPGGGDELQGVKRGIVELADLLLVNKADGALREQADRTAGDYRNALALLRPSVAAWTPQVLTCSALAGDGMAAIWDRIEAYRAALRESGDWAARRRAQALDWLWSELGEGLIEAVRSAPRARPLLEAAQAEVRDGVLPPAVAARRIVQAVFQTED